MSFILISQQQDLVLALVSETAANGYATSVGHNLAESFPEGQRTFYSLAKDLKGNVGSDMVIGFTSSMNSGYQLNIVFGAPNGAVQGWEGLPGETVHALAGVIARGDGPTSARSSLMSAEMRRSFDVHSFEVDNHGGERRFIYVLRTHFQPRRLAGGWDITTINQAGGPVRLLPVREEAQMKFYDESFSRVLPRTHVVNERSMQAIRDVQLLYKRQHAINTQGPDQDPAVVEVVQCGPQGAKDLGSTEVTNTRSRAATAAVPVNVWSKAGAASHYPPHANGMLSTGENPLRALGSQEGAAMLSVMLKTKAEASCFNMPSGLVEQTRWNSKEVPIEPDMFPMYPPDTVRMQLPAVPPTATLQLPMNPPVVEQMQQFKRLPALPPAPERHTLGKPPSVAEQAPVAQMPTAKQLRELWFGPDRVFEIGGKQYTSLTLPMDARTLWGVEPEKAGPQQQSFRRLAAELGFSLREHGNFILDAKYSSQRASITKGLRCLQAAECSVAIGELIASRLAEGAEKCAAVSYDTARNKLLRMAGSWPRIDVVLHEGVLAVTVQLDEGSQRKLLFEDYKSKNLLLRTIAFIDAVSLLDVACSCTWDNMSMAYYIVTTWGQTLKPIVIQDPGYVELKGIGFSFEK